MPRRAAFLNEPDATRARIPGSSSERRHAGMRKRQLFVSVGLVCLVCGRSAARERAVEEEATRIVSKYKGVFTRPPRRIPTNKVVDAPLVGNGDIGVAIGGAGDSQAFFIGKNDFWSRRARRVITVGRVNVRIPGLAGASYACEQDLLNAEVRGRFTKDGLTVEMRSWTAATENLLVTELTCGGAGAIPVAVNHSIGPGGAGGGARGGGRIRENNNHVNIGREQHGGGRWGFRGLIDVCRRGSMDRRAQVRLDRAALVHRLAHDVQDAPQGSRPHRHRDRFAGV